MAKARKFTTIDIGSDKFVLHVPVDMEDYHKELLEKLFTAQSASASSIIADVRSVSDSGMSRKLAFWLCRDNKLFTLNSLISKILDMKLQKGLIVARGYGMDMIWDTLHDFWSVALRTKDGKMPELEDIRKLISYDRLPMPW